MKGAERSGKRLSPQTSTLAEGDLYRPDPSISLHSGFLSDIAFSLIVPRGSPKSEPDLIAEKKHQFVNDEKAKCC